MKILLNIRNDKKSIFHKYMILKADQLIHLYILDIRSILYFL